MSGSNQPCFSSSNAYRIFEQSVISHRRYVHDDETRTFLETVLRSAQDRIIEELPNTILYRAQTGTETPGTLTESGKPHPAERMRPLPNEAREGRLNPKGIPCLYLAYSEITAISEVRPQVGEDVSVAQFFPTKNLRIVDCTKDISPLPELSAALADTSGSPPTAPAKIEKLVWSEINRAFAKPITNVDERSEYAPTQIIAELFKTNGFDGIKFNSSVNKGMNIALFNIEDVKLENCQVKYIQSCKYEYSDAWCYERYGSFHEIASLG